MSQSAPHEEASIYLRDVLKAWAERTDKRKRGQRPRFHVTYERCLRWDASNPRVGLDPDIAVYEPPPPEYEGLRSVRTWVKGHEPPKLAIEVVSHTNSNKDYFAAPEKYTASGTGELWVFDPLLDGPKAHGGPFRIQVWVRQGEEEFVRTYAGDGPAFSPYLNAWLVPTDEGRKLRISDDQSANTFWPTKEEVVLAREHAALSREQAALARIAELEAELAKRS